MSAHFPWFSRNAVALGAVAALSVGVLAACSSSSNSTTPSSSTTPTSPASSSGSKAPITIGISLSLTGDFSADGQAYDQGYNLWAKDVNAAGGILGRQVKLTILNDDSSTSQVVTNYDTLISADHVDLTFGPFSSLLTTPASAVAARNGYAFVEGAGGAPTVFDTQSNEADHNVMVPDGWYGGYKNAESEKMVAEYDTEYKTTPSDINADIAEAYSVGQVVDQAIVATGGTDNAAIIKYLHSGVTLQTVQGPVTFDSLGENGASAAFVFQWNSTGTVFQQVLPASDPASVPIIATKPPWTGPVG